MRFRAIYLIIFSLILTANFSAEALEICGDIRQGELILIKDKNAREIIVSNNLKDRKYKVFDDGISPVALHRDVSQKIKLKVYSLSGAMMSYELQITPAQWDIQRVNGVEQHKVTPSKSHQKEINRELSAVNRALSVHSAYAFWRDGFILPLDGRISGNFGNQRIFNGTPKSPHSGTDIAAPEGTPVKASGNGKVILSGQDYFYTGNMVILDHGAGLQTIYAHLQKAVVKSGDEVKKGDVIGFVGKTGRATGPHLHWGASLNGVRFRPHSLLDINTKTCRKVSDKHRGDEVK